MIALLQAITGGLFFLVFLILIIKYFGWDK